MLQMEIKRVSLSIIGQPEFSQLEATFDQLIGTHDYAGLTLILSDHFAKSDSNLAKRLLTAVVNRWVVSFNHDQSTRHFSCCLLRAERHGDALLIADSLAARNPDDQHYQLFRIQILAGSPGRFGDAKNALEVFKKDYVLEEKWKASAEELEAHLENEEP